MGIGDTLVVAHAEQKIQEVIKMGIGTIVSLERHPGAFDIAHMRDAEGHEFITRGSNIFALGDNDASLPVTLPKNRGVKVNVIEEREQRLVAAEAKKQARASQGKKRRH